MTRMYESIYLGSSSYEVTVSSEGYEQIIEMVRAHSVCSHCQQSYTGQNPNVSANACLLCFWKQYRTWAFKGELDPALDPGATVYGPYSTKYLFLTGDGHARVTYAGPGKDEKPREDERITLRYWSFPVPLTAEKNGETVKICPSTGYLYGDVRTNEILLLHCIDGYEGIDVLFLLKRNGAAVQINKRKGVHRQMFADARKELEATRTPDGWFLIDGEDRYQIGNGDIYDRMVKRLNEECREIEQSRLTL